MDIRLHNILVHEKQRQDNTAELIASENFASDSVMELCGSILTNKYAEGLPGKRYYNGCEFADQAEQLAIEQATKLFGASFANVQPHSGANANTAVYQAFLKPGDTILGMDLASGGHLSHGASVNISGKLYNAVSYGVNDVGWIDYDAVEQLAHEHRPKMVVAGASAYPRRIDWQRMRSIADSVNALLLVDMSHYSGLIAGGVYDSPVDLADVVTSTTHKTLRGPRGGIILWNNPDYTRRINSSVFPGTQGGPLMHIIAAKAQCFIEANSDEFKDYAHRVIDNAQALSRVLEQRGFQVQTYGTDSHIVLVNLSNKAISGREASDLLEANGITVNKNGVPNDRRSFAETSGIRLGTAAETTRGHDREWFEQLGHRIVDILSAA